MEQEILTDWRKIRQIKESHTPASELKKRGWTGAMIEEFLGSPDILVRNPVVRSGAPMCLYANSRIDAIESSESFAQRKIIRELRGKIQKKISEQKKGELLAWVNALDIQVRFYTKKSLLFEDAIRHYNNRSLDRENVLSHVGHWSSCDVEFLHRITVNFLRHQGTSYEEKLDEIFGKTGVNAAYIAIKKKVLEAIAKEYLFLAEECKRQMESVQEYSPRVRG